MDSRRADQSEDWVAALKANPVVREGRGSKRMEWRRRNSPPGGGTSQLVAGNVSSGNRTGQMTMSSRRKHIEARKTESLVQRSAGEIFFSLPHRRRFTVSFARYRAPDA